ncbi:condensation domain-containing protein [Streptomyces sp. URMC 123]|uniref:condensation domain-containing protein n=1 Tax=Streptomyces sp. URMC 123 TaxID=3423403 RepID=UPI003F1933B7
MPTETHAATADDARARQEALLRRARSRAGGRTGADAPASRTPAAEPGADRSAEQAPAWRGAAPAAPTGGPTEDAARAAAQGAAGQDAPGAPLSRAQRRMWLMDRLGQGGALYSVPFATRVRGPLDLDALGTALTALVARHEVLRTRYRQHGDEPYQDVAAPGPVPVEVLDAPSGSVEPLLAEARKPFDLAEGPVLRALALRHGPRDHTVMLTLHHIAVDGPSLDVVVQELAELYAAAREGRRAALPAAPQYADFARREHADGERLAEGLRHWAERLAGARPPSLPRPAVPAAPADRGARSHAAPLSPRVLEGLREVGRRHRATLFTVVLTAAFAALHRLTGEDDLVIGCASTHREGSAMRGLVGLCVNTLPLRVDVSGDPAFGELLDRVRDTLLEAQNYRSTPFDLVVERLGAAARGRDGTPLVRVTADVLREPTALRLPGTEGEAVDVDPGAAKFDLTFAVEEAEAPRCLLQHARTALDEETGERLLAGFATLLTAVAETPDRALSVLPGAAFPATASANGTTGPTEATGATGLTGPAVHPVEECLLTHPDVAEAAVLVPADGGGSLAYAVARRIGGASPTELRAYVRSRLAPELVPAAVMLLDAMPRTAGGAVDAGRLPGAPAAAVAVGATGAVTASAAGSVGEAGAPPVAGGGAGHSAVGGPAGSPEGARPAGAGEPRGNGSDTTAGAAAAERLTAVTDAFAELLGHRPGPDDDFFVLGGHSLVAVQLAERLRTSQQLPLTGLDIMEQRTPLALAALLDARAAERDEARARRDAAEAHRKASAAAGAAAGRRGAREGTVLVTGGTGGVGAFVIRELAARGTPVRALARPESAHRLFAGGVAGAGAGAGAEGAGNGVAEAVEVVEVVEGDLSDLDSLRAAMEGVDAVIHAACTFTRPEVDVAAMRALVDSWRGGSFVFVSSVDAYGRPETAEVAEGAPSTEPLSPYGRAKLECERMLMRAAGTDGRGGASAVRSPIVWGAHHRLREQLRWGATGRLFQAALSGEPIVLPEPGTAGQAWYGAPWVHAAALARALAVCVEAPVHGVANAVGGHVAWSDFAAELVRLLGSGSEIRRAPEVHGDLDHRWHYRADRLAAPLRERAGEDWRTVLASMVEEETAGA